MTKQEEQRVLNQRLQRVHQSIGISFALLMYIALFFGIFAILLPYIKNWETPIRHYKMIDITSIDYNSLVEPVLANPDFPKINPVIIRLPGSKSDPSLRISTNFVETLVINPHTNETFLDDENRSNLASFLNLMHYGGHFKFFGLIIFGIMALAVMFLIISAIFLIKRIKYSDKTEKLSSKFLKYHRKIFLWTFVPLMIITLSGAMFNIGFLTSSPMTYIVSKGQTFEPFALVQPYLFPKEERIERKNDEAKMLSIAKLVEKAQNLMPQVQWHNIKITNYGDSTCRVKLEGYNPYKPFLNGVLNLPSITLSGVDAQVLEKKEVLDSNWGAMLVDSILFLHFLFGVDLFTRIIVLLLMLLSTFALVFGVLVYLEKKARNFPSNIPVYQALGKISLACMLGVIPATGLLFFLQWLLPFDMENRLLIQQGLFAVLWSASLTWSFYRLNSYQAAKEFLYLGGVLFLFSPIIHFISSGFSPFRLWEEEIYTILAIDILLFVFALILLLVAYKLPTNRTKIEKFWSKYI